ncbi:MAG: glycosyltransferase [Acidimicrobiales bacterium]|nr:glycosyltransferase [Acidimicrobiales bacterium]MCB9392573.1 glycosyltransferase [Acidimicrobiaceae bacterium]
MRSIVSIPLVCWRARRRIAAEHRREPFDVFYVHFKREQILLTRFLSRRAPVVWMEHGHLPRGRLRPQLEWAYRRASRHVTTTICVSTSVRDEMMSVTGRSAHHFEVIENALEDGWIEPPTPEERRYVRRHFGIPPDAELVLVSVARLIPRKRIELAIDAVAQMPGAWLIVCGDGPLAADLRRRAADNPRVIFTGHLPDPRDVYRAGDVQLLLSWEEGFGQVLLEGAAAGIPAVVVADGGFADRVEGWGAVARSPDAAAVAAACAQARTIAPERTVEWARARRSPWWADAHRTVLRRGAGKVA